MEHFLETWGYLAVWEKADINYNGRRHDDEENEAVVSEDNDNDEQEIESELSEEQSSG